ncbi:MAG: peptidase M16 [Robiginitomaculum sp.]|nr:MAG: peptidase M16 [Robiginitomaculum sp.]
MKKYLLNFSCAAALLLSACATMSSTLPNGVTFVEKASTSKDTLVVPYEKLELDNGLTVLLHHDASDPIVHVNVTYHVGSNREELGKSGFAHFFEHMMFQGSRNVGDEQHFKIVSEAGGTLNGTTNLDKTNYYETVPKNHLEKMLWLEADRMGFLLPAITQESFEVQRATVKNERGQRVDNKPYGLVREKNSQALYPYGHPYSWPTIGHTADLNRVDVNDLKAFFKRWYGPNNAVITIGGDFDRAQTLDWVVKYFGSIPRGPEVTDLEKTKVTLDKDRYVSLEDNITLPLIQKSWPTVYARHEDEAPLDVLMQIIGSGKTSLLYQNMVKNGYAVQANAGHGCSELSCTFTVTALPSPAKGKSLANLDAIIADTFIEFESRGVLQSDLDRMKIGIRKGFIYGLESVQGKVSSLARWETFDNNPNLAQAELDRYEAVTSDDVMRVYHQYIKGKPSVTMSVVPKGQKHKVAKADNWWPTKRALPQSSSQSASIVQAEINDNFDRSIQPPSTEVPIVTIPTLWHTQLDNGIKVSGSVSTEIPTTAITVRMRTGQKDEPIGKLGLAGLTAAMMNQATKNTSAEDLSTKLQLLGSGVGIGAGTNSTSLSISSLSENLDATLEIAREKLMEPGFKQEDFDRLQNNMLEGIRSSKKKAAANAGSALSLLLYGRDNAFAYPGSGLEETVSNLTLADVKQYYKDHYSASIAEIITVSDLSKSDLTEKLSIFNNWQKTPVKTADIKPFPKLAGGTLYLIDKPDAAQSEIRIAKRSLIYDATGENYLTKLIAYPLGGAFNSRINLNLREDKGYTYGARAGFSGGKYTGSFGASAGVKRDATKDAIVEFFKEIDGFAKTGMTQEELDFTKSAKGQKDAGAYETARQKLGLIGHLLNYDLPEDYKAEQKKVLDGLTVEDTQRLAKAHLQSNDMIIVVVGDKAKILKDLQTLPYPIVDIDELGRELAIPRR